MSTKPEYKVVTPIGKPSAQRIPLSPSLSSLEGKTIALEWNNFPNGDVILDAFADLLGKRFKGLRGIKLPAGKGLKWGEDNFDKSVGAVVKESGADAAIVAVGG